MCSQVLHRTSPISKPINPASADLTKLADAPRPGILFSACTYATTVLAGLADQFSPSTPGNANMGDARFPSFKVKTNHDQETSRSPHRSSEVIYQDDILYLRVVSAVILYSKKI